MNLDIIVDNYQQLLSGTWTTLWLVALSLILGLLIAVPAAVMCASNSPWLRLPASAYSYVFRGTPLLIQLYIFYYGFGLLLGQIDSIKDSIWWGLISHAWPWALLAMVLNTGAYTCEILRGAIKNTPDGEIEAAKSMGFQRGKMLRRIILPSAFRRALPAYGNEIIYMLHGSAIISTVTILDITGVARKLRDDYYEPYTPFIGAALIYLVITMVLVYSFKLIEKRYLSHLSR